MYKKNITLFKGKIQPASLLVYQKLKIEDACCWERSDRSHKAPQGVGKNTWANFVLFVLFSENLFVWGSEKECSTICHGTPNHPHQKYPHQKQRVNKASSRDNGG